MRFILPCLTLVAFALAAYSDQTLFDFGPGFDFTKIKGHDATASDGKSDAGPALRLALGHAQPWPGIDLSASDGHWDLAKFTHLTLDVRNAGTKEATLHCRVDNQGADGVSNCVTGGLTLKPGAKGTMEIEFKRRAALAAGIKLFGMRGYPEGLNASGSLDPASIVNLVVFVDHPQEDNVFEISNIRATGAYTPPPAEVTDPARFFPFIDEFGQYIHRDWPGKTHSEAEFAAHLQAEDADLKAHAGPPDWNKYGGWNAGPALKATGFFRVEKVRGKWWFVDPEGKLFFAHGVDCVNPYEGTTPLDDRDGWYRNLPARDGRFASCYGRAGAAVHGYYVGKPMQTFAFGRANLMRKYGDDFMPGFAAMSHRRLRSWGLNTIANWSDSAIHLQRKTPYTATIGFGSKMLEGSQGYWGKFRDVFDPSFQDGIRKAVQGQVGTTANDPWCLGYFVDNEIAWGDEVSLATAALVSPPEQAAKGVFIADLKAKYTDIAKLNEVWGSEYASWEAMLESRALPDRRKAYRDLTAFYTKTAETYFKVIRDAIRETSPNTLYFGCRFAWVNNLAASAAAKYCDVVSYNLYRRSVADFHFPGKADVPLIIGEFHFGALDRGMFHTGLVPTASQDERARCYKDYLQGALRNPAFIGTGWFKYMDEPTTGRPMDEENYQIGLVDGCDTPYPETIAALREVGYGMYDYRLNSK